MKQSQTNILIVLGAVIALGCLCVFVLAVGGTGLFLAARTSSSPPPQTIIADTLPSSPTEPVSPGETPPAGQTIESTPTQESIHSVPTTPTQSSQSQEIPAEIISEMDEIEKQVIALRGLTPKGRVGRALLTPQELRQRVIDDFLDDYTDEEARDDALTLTAFGLLEPDFDLYDFYLELLSEQIAGFYDDETKQMYVIQGEGFYGPERLTYAHEYTHALQDQNFDFKNGLGYTDEACEQDSERCAAIQALIEGDASILELEWFSNHATPLDIFQIQEFYRNYQSPIFDSAPVFLQEDFLFPYTYGQAFVQSLYDEGGWAAVDRAYQDLPLSTEQILHPERYPEDKPRTINLPELTGSLPDGWRERDRGVMGEWYSYLILAFGLDPDARLNESQAQTACEGWGGDAYVVLYNDRTDETAMILSTSWESSAEAVEFASAFEEYANARFGSFKEKTGHKWIWESSNGVTVFIFDRANTIWVFAPDMKLADQLIRLSGD